MGLGRSCFGYMLMYEAFREGDGMKVDAPILKM